MRGGCPRVRIGCACVQIGAPCVSVGAPGVISDTSPAAGATCRASALRGRLRPVQHEGDRLGGRVLALGGELAGQVGEARCGHRARLQRGRSGGDVHGVGGDLGHERLAGALDLETNP